MNIFTIFLYKILANIFTKTHQIAPFLKIFSGEHAPKPPLANAWQSAMQIPPLLPKYFEPPPK